MQTQPLRWTVATALVADVDNLADYVDVFAALNADAIGLQSVSESNSKALAEQLGMTSVWSVSFYRRTPLVKSSGVGLSVVTPHNTHDPVERVVSTSTSNWSRDRRIAQSVTVERADHSGYAIRHSVSDPGQWPPTAAPPVTLRPQQVDADAARAIELPPEASDIEVHPVVALASTGATIAVTSFSQQWVVSNVPL